jgi:hypothetical protein
MFCIFILFYFILKKKKKIVFKLLSVVERTLVHSNGYTALHSTLPW